MKHSEEHWDVLGEETLSPCWRRDELDSREEEGREDRSERAVESVSDSLLSVSGHGEARFLGMSDLAGRSQFDRSRAQRTFSMVHTLSSWLEFTTGLEVVPGKLRDSSKDWSSSMLIDVVVSVAEDSPSVVVVAEYPQVIRRGASCDFAVGFIRFFPTASHALLVAPSAESEIDNSPMRWVESGTAWRGSLYVKVPEFQSL